MYAYVLISLLFIILSTKRDLRVEAIKNHKGIRKIPKLPADHTFP